MFNWIKFKKSDSVQSFRCEVDGIFARYGNYSGHFEWAVYDSKADRNDYLSGYATGSDATLDGIQSSAEQAIEEFLEQRKVK